MNLTELTISLATLMKMDLANTVDSQNNQINIKLGDNKMVVLRLSKIN